MEVEVLKFKGYSEYKAFVKQFFRLGLFWSSEVGLLKKSTAGDGSITAQFNKEMLYRHIQK